MLRLRRFTTVVIALSVARVTLRGVAHWLERRNNGATRTSRTLVWVGDALPRSRRSHAHG